jgi:hypothetical protein
MTRTLKTTLMATTLGLPLAACGMMQDDTMATAETAAAPETERTATMVTAADLDGAQVIDRAQRPVGNVAMAQFGGDQMLDQVIVTMDPAIGQEEARVLVPGREAAVVMVEGVPMVQLSMTVEQLRDLAQAAPNEP